MKIRNVLIFPAGTEIGLEILNALKYCKEVRLFGAGQDVLNHGQFVFSEYHVLPSVYEENWLPSLVTLCNELSIDYIFPAYDDVIVALSREQKRIPATVIAPESQTCEIARSKSKTYRRLDGVVRVPRVYSNKDNALNFPLLVKPDKGQGSVGIKKVNDHNELIRATQGVSDAIICEYLPGDEYTVDCFSDRKRGLLFAKARSRRRIRNGIAVNTITEDIADVQNIANRIGEVLKMRGAWFFQLKRDKSGELALLEVAPRIAGSMAIHRMQGVNFPLLSIFEYERLHIEILTNQGAVELDRSLSNRYRYDIEYTSLYVDLDDTLVINGKVNPVLISLIYQAIGQDKQVILITRHAGDLQKTLVKYKLVGLFDKIIHLRGGEKKSAYIAEANAIFVDDSFAERSDVSKVHGIPTFDCSMVELLVRLAESN